MQLRDQVERAEGHAGQEGIAHVPQSGVFSQEHEHDENREVNRGGNDLSDEAAERVSQSHECVVRGDAEQAGQTGDQHHAKESRQCLREIPAEPDAQQGAG